MQKHLVLTLAVLLLTGCGTKPMTKGQSNDKSKDPPRAEMRIGDATGESPHLSFRITGVHEQQKPAPDAPYHIEGGEWTFFDCLMRVWWVDGKTKAKKLLQGPEKGLALAEVPVSPDHRYVALHRWKTNPGGKGRTEFLQILNRANGEVKVCESQGKDFYPIGWRKTETGARVIAVTNRWQFDKKEVSELYLVDPATGKFELQGNVDARLEIDNPLSPDGKHRVRVGKDELIVTDTERGEQRRFAFHVDDRRFVGPECAEWVAPRYVKFKGPRLALIDVTTMKMCFPASADGARFGSDAYKFSPDFHWVLFQGEGSDGEGLFLSRVEMPPT